jgi:hypothetical protein
MRPFNIQEDEQDKVAQNAVSINRKQLQLPSFNQTNSEFNNFGCASSMQNASSFNSPKIKESFVHISRFNIGEKANDF